eukprot:TRINITY_DN4165_c0_g2_i2.p1 TRINITY_DN4165_c0_g2~~TRINITY_DN4165_c0_g2_i2.p1  ORF type:complete len:283 (+),score=43.51 TRINITY_DN4165_c0_g2_i2:90-938(+)
MFRCSPSRILRPRSSVSSFNLPSHFPTTSRFFAKRGLLTARVEPTSFEPLFTQEHVKSHLEKFYLEPISRVNKLFQDTPYALKSNDDVPQMICEFFKEESFSRLSDPLQEVKSYRAALQKNYLPQADLRNNRAALADLCNIYNHEFFFRSIKPRGFRDKRRPDEVLSARMDVFFGGYDGFKKMLIELVQTTRIMGSGWIWLVDKKGQLELMRTYEHESIQLLDPESEQHITPLLAMDLWEHAWVISHGNLEDYVTRYLQLVDWEFASNNLKKVKREYQVFSY